MKYFIYISFAALGILAFFGCENDLPTQTRENPLAIQEVNITRNEITNQLHVQAHIQPATGVPVDSVWFVAYQPDGQVPYLKTLMYDNGQHGDIVPFNKWYSADIDSGYIASYLPPEANLEFPVHIFAQDSVGSMVAVDTMFHLLKNYSVEIVNIVAPDTLNATDNELGLIQVGVVDSNGVSDVKQVTLQQYAKVQNGDTLDSPGQIVKLDNTGNPNAGDAVATDSVYSVIIQTVPQISAGLRFMRIVAEDFARATDTSYIQIYIAN